MRTCLVDYLIVLTADGGLSRDAIYSTFAATTRQAIEAGLLHFRKLGHLRGTLVIWRLGAPTEGPDHPNNLTVAAIDFTPGSANFVPRKQYELRRAQRGLFDPPDDTWLRPHWIPIPPDDRTPAPRLRDHRRRVK